MLLGIKPKYIEIIKEDNEEIERKDEVIVAIYNKSLTKRGEYQALVGIE